MNEQKIETKARIWWIMFIQYLFLFYYLSYSNTLINNNIILVISCLILLIEIIMRAIYNNKRMSLCLFVACVGSLWTFFCSYINGSGFGSAITQTSLLISVCMFAETKILPSQRKKIMVHMTIILLLVLIIFSEPSMYRSYYMPNLPYFSDSVKINPNCIAMLTYFLFIFLYEIIEDTGWRKKRKRLLQIVIMILLMYYIFLTSARTTIVSCIIFLLLFSMCRYKNQKLTRNLFFVGLCMSLGIVFIYISMYLSGFMIGDTVWGKGFYTGRQVIWIEALELVREHFLFGFSNKIAFGPKGMLSVHNSLLAILCYFGVFGLFSTIVVLFMSFKKIECKKHPLTVSAIFSTLIIMCFETVITDWSLLLPFCLLFIQTKSREVVGSDS